MVTVDSATQEWAVMQVTDAHGCLDAPVEQEPECVIDLPAPREGD